MAGAQYATPNQVRDLWDGMPEIPQKIVTTTISLASALLRSNVRRLDERLEDDTLDPEIVAGIVAAMVRRHLTDPVTVEQMEDTTTRFDISDLEGGILPRPEELAQLAPVAVPGSTRGGRVRAGSARLLPGL